MKLLELFDHGGETKWIANEDGLGKAEFTVDGNSYGFQISKYKLDDPDVRAYVVEFSLTDNGNVRYDNTGTGNQFRVYGTVLTLIREYTGKWGEGILIFGATDDKRKTLYTRLFQKFLPDWTVEQVFEMIVAKPPGQEDVFVI